jgi:hypothetical protein
MAPRQCVAVSGFSTAGLGVAAQKLQPMGQEYD